MMDAGNRDECVRVFKNGDTGRANDFGDSIGPEDVTVIPEYHVRMIAKTVREKLSAAGETYRERYLMIGLYDTVIDAEMFVEWEGTKFSIENVDHRRSMDETHCLITTAKGRFE